MATTNFVDGLTVVVADWLNDVDEHVYQQDTTAHPAAHITVTPSGGIAATNVQTALTELDGDLTSGLASKANLSGATFSGAVSVPAGASGTQVPQAQEVVGKTSTTGSAVMPAGNTAQRDGSPASGYTRTNSDLLAVESYLGSEWVSMRTVQGTRVATTSGTAFDFTGIPAWATEITLVFSNVSLSGTDNIDVLLGTSGGFVVTGYVSTSNHANSSAVTSVSSTTSFRVNTAAATNTISASFRIKKWRGGTRLFTQEHSGRAAGTTLIVGGGDVTLSDELTQIRVTRSGTNTFDSGELTIFWS